MLLGTHGPLFSRSMGSWEFEMINSGRSYRAALCKQWLPTLDCPSAS